MRPQFLKSFGPYLSRNKDNEKHKKGGKKNHRSEAVYGIYSMPNNTTKIMICLILGKTEQKVVFVLFCFVFPYKWGFPSL